jgi:hypothetical protein
MQLKLSLKIAVQLGIVPREPIHCVEFFETRNRHPLVQLRVQYTYMGWSTGGITAI